MAGPTGTPPTGRMLARGALKRCPVCGRGGLFRRWFVMAERCPRCGLRFDRIEGHFIGALGLNTIVTFTVLFLVLVGALFIAYPEFEMTGLLIATVGTAVVLPLLFHPYSRTLWTAIDLAMRPLEPGEVTGPTDRRKAGERGSGPA